MAVVCPLLLVQDFDWDGPVYFMTWFVDSLVVQFARAAFSAVAPAFPDVDPVLTVRAVVHHMGLTYCVTLGALGVASTSCSEKHVTI
jgi:hypothetical protein